MARIGIADSSNSWRIDNVRGVYTDNQFLARNELEDEKEQQIVNANRRKETFKNVLSNAPSEDGWLRSFIYGFILIPGPYLSTCFYTLIPVHNVFTNPQNWYEFPMQVFVGLLPPWAAMVIFRCSYYMNIKYIKNLYNFFVMWFIGGVFIILLYGIEYILWAMLLEYQYPMPLNGYILACTMMIVFYATLWTRFPYQWRKNGGFKKRLIFFFVSITLNQAVLFEYAAITISLLKIPRNFQWIAALFFPLVREFNRWIGFKFALKASDGDITSVVVTCNQAIGTTHQLFLAYTIGSSATLATSAIILGTDFVINTFTCLRIIYARKKEPANIEKQLELIQELVVSEMIEFMVPILYLLVFISAYYGPNAKLIGNVGNSFWQYTAVQDFRHTIEFIVIFFTIDFSSTVISTFLLWMLCRINLLRVYSALQNEFGLSFMAATATNLSGVRETFLD